MTLGTAIISEVASFHVQQEQDLFEASSDQWTGVVHTMQSDATKAKSHGEDKLGPTRLVTAYVYGPDQVHRRCVWPDLQTANDGPVAYCIRLVRLHLRSVQCIAFDLEHAKCLGPRQIRLIVFCDDDGTDQCGKRSGIAKLYRHELHVWVVGGECKMHQMSIACCRTIAAIDRVTLSWHWDTA